MANFFSSGLSHFKMFWVFRACCSDISDVRFAPNRSCLFCPWDKRLAEEIYVTDSVSSFGYLHIYIYTYIYIYICIYIHWVVPPPRMPVTTRITMFLAGDPYKSEFATVARRGDNPRYILKSTWWLGARIPNDTWFQVGFMILMFKRNEPRFNCFMLWCAPRLIGDAGFSMLFLFLLTQA